MTSSAAEYATMQYGVASRYEVKTEATSRANVHQRNIGAGHMACYSFNSRECAEGCLVPLSSGGFQFPRQTCTMVSPEHVGPLPPDLIHITVRHSLTRHRTPQTVKRPTARPLYRATAAARTAAMTPPTGPMLAPAVLVDAAVVVPEAEPDRVAVPVTEGEVPEPLAVAVTEAEPDSVPVAEPVALSEAVPDSVAVADSVPEAVPVAEPEAVAEPVAEPDPVAEADPEPEAEPLWVAILAQAALAADWALATSAGLHLLRMQPDTRGSSFACASGLQAQATSSSLQPILGMASLRQGI